MRHFLAEQAGGSQAALIDRAGTLAHGGAAEPRPPKKFLSATMWNRRNKVVVLDFCLINAVYDFDLYLELTDLNVRNYGLTNTLCVGFANCKNNQAKGESCFFFKKKGCKTSTATQCMSA